MNPTFTTRISELMPYILPKAPTVPLPYAEFQARLAVIEFCERTRCWRHIMQTNISASGTTFVTPLTATIHEFEEVTLDGQILIPTQFTDVQPEELSGERQAGRAKYISQLTPGQVAVYPPQAGKLRISCFLKPRHGQAIGCNEDDPLADAYNVLPAFMLTQYATALADGALYRIMSTNNQDFTDMTMAAMHKMAFDAACDRHFGSNMRGQQRAPIRTKPRFM